MKILIACEESQTIATAFRNRGFEAYSCDIQKCGGLNPSYHIQGDAIAEAYSGKYDITYRVTLLPKRIVENMI